MRDRFILKSSLVAPLLVCTLGLTVGACIPKKSDSSSSSKSESSTTSDTLSLSGMKVGPSNVSAETDNNGNYFSRFTPLTANGLCKGSVKQVKIDYTPLSGATTTETVTCSGTSFTWSKALNTQTTYNLVFTALDGSGTTLSSVPTLNKTYTYDITTPSSPTFVSPTTSTSYTITDGTQNVTIIGQVPKDVTKLIGPLSSILPLSADPDNIHKNFIYSAVVPVGVTSIYEFTGYDPAGNFSSSTLSISSVLELSVPVARQEIGGSTVKPNMTIESTVGVMSEVVVDQNIEHSTGSAGIIGSMGEL